MSPEDRIRMLRMLPNAKVRGPSIPMPPRPEMTGGPFGNDPDSPFYYDGPDQFPFAKPSPQPPAREYSVPRGWQPKMIIGVDGTPVPAVESTPYVKRGGRAPLR